MLRSTAKNFDRLPGDEWITAKIRSGNRAKRFPDSQRPGLCTNPSIRLLHRTTNQESLDASLKHHDTQSIHQNLNEANPNHRARESDGVESSFLDRISRTNAQISDQLQRSTISGCQSPLCHLDTEFENKKLIRDQFATARLSQDSTAPVLIESAGQLATSKSTPSRVVFKSKPTAGQTNKHHRA